jgi:hypothetical protein
LPEYNTAEERRNDIFVKNNKIMATLQIFSNNTDDLYLLDEMARRMNLKTEMNIPESEKSAGRTRTVVDYEDTAEGVVEAVKRGLEFEKKLDAGLVEAQSLREMLDEN